MEPDPGAPPATSDDRARHAIADLSTRGYRVVEDEYWPESFGNRFVALHGNGVRCELAKDRGEWLVSLGSSAAPELGSYEPSLWLLVLPRAPATSLAAADEFVLLERVLADVEAVLSRGRTYWHELRLAREERLARQFGVPPPSGPTEKPSLLRPRADAGATRKEAMVRVARQRHEKKHRPR